MNSTKHLQGAVRLAANLTRLGQRCAERMGKGKCTDALEDLVNYHNRLGGLEAQVEAGAVEADMALLAIGEGELRTAKEMGKRIASAYFLECVFPGSQQ